MLFKIIQTRPVFVAAWTIGSKTLVHHFGAAARLLLVDAFLMSGKVVYRAKAFFTSAVRVVTPVLFAMSCFMFSVCEVSLEGGSCAFCHGQGDTHFLSDGHFPLQEQFG